MMYIRQQKNRIRNKGVSLLELIIYVAILSGLTVAVSTAFISLSKGRGQSEARSEVNASLRFAAEKIKQDIKDATAVVSPVSGISSSTLNITVGGIPTIYDVSNGQLRRNSVPVTPPTVFVMPPSFIRIENYNSVFSATTTAVQVAMSIRYNASSTDWSYADSLSTTISLR